MLVTLASWTHDLSPFVVRISGSLGIRWYGLAYVAGFVIAWLALKALAKRKLILIPPGAVADLILAQVIGVMVGGRIGYVLLYQPSMLVNPPWWDIFDITSGGMASHGGMVGIIVASWWAARRYKVPALHVLDCTAAASLPGVVLGRLANFINAELLGKVVAPPGEPAPWWAVRYPQELLDRPTPAQEHHIITTLGIAPENYIPATRALIESIQRGDADALAIVEPILSARHPSQLYQAAAEGLLTLAIVILVWRKPRKPGVILATVLITYAIARVATEFIRLPDAHLAIQRFAGLSRGQWLSLVMLTAGITILALVARSSAQKIGGWATRRPAQSPSV